MDCLIDEFNSIHEYEAESVARRLSIMLRNKNDFAILDKKASPPSLRPLEQKDVAVLFRARTHVTEYEEAFRRKITGTQFVGDVSFNTN